MATETPKNILVAPLDWGLGHTTRCVPLIRYLQQLGHHAIVAGNESQLSFIRETFDKDVQTVSIEGYNVTYSKWNRLAQIGLLAQLPAISAAISKEHSWLNQKAAELQLHGIIADNRYGLHHAQVPSVIITHQLQVLSGMGSLADRVVQRLHYKLLQRFGSIWVPDAAAEDHNLGGKLSHPASLPRQTQYIGLISRFSAVERQPLHLQQGKPLLVLLSGPEPQRSAVSAMLWAQVAGYKGPVTFVEGSDTIRHRSNIPAHITYYTRLAGAQLQPLLLAAGLIICRSGYSTVMDLVALGKPAILIPTPGQTEQEYLARHLHEQRLFYAAGQDGFELHSVLKAATVFAWNTANLQGAFDNYKPVISNWLSRL